MKRSVILAVVVVVALALAGTSGVFATWSDSEVSHNNTIRTGSLDLKVNGADDEPWGTGVPVKVDIYDMIPCKFYGPFEVELWNAGQGDFASHAYIELKDFECSNIEPKVNPRDPAQGGSDWWPRGATTGYPAPADDPNAGQLKPEPELVAEHGGKVDCFEVPGIGPEGDECSLGTHIEMIVTLSRVPPNVAGADIVRRDKIVKWEGEVYLFYLMPCEPKTIYLWFHMQQDSEEDYGFNFVPNPGQEGYDELYWMKFNDWPSWALMKDQIVLDIQFDLWLEDSPGGIVSP